MVNHQENPVHSYFYTQMIACTNGVYQCLHIHKCGGAQNNINMSSPSTKMCFINRAISFAYKMYKTPEPSLPSNDMATHTKRESDILGGGRCMPKMYFGVVKRLLQRIRNQGWRNDQYKK